VGNVQYLYDKAGNTTPDQSLPLTRSGVEGRLYDGGSNMYAYDGENRLLTVTKTADALSAACDTSLTLTTGGTGAWFAQSSEHCEDSDNDGVQSPDIDDSQSTWIETSVQGAGTIKFCWKVSSQTGDNMSFSIDGQVRQGGLSGNGDWSEQQSHEVSGSGTHTLRWRYSKDASGSGGSDCMWLDHIVWTPSTGDLLADAVDSTLSYTTGGNKIWTIETDTYYYDGDAAASGDDVNDYEQSWMQNADRNPHWSKPVLGNGVTC
jgi:hypothetical protein